MFLKRIALTLPFLFACNIFAESNAPLVSDIETVMSGNCLASYQQKYHKLKDHKVFVYSRDNEGNDTCSWNYKSSSIEKAKKSALKRCEKRIKKEKMKSKCEVIDIDSKIVINEGLFSKLKKAEYPALTDKTYKELHEKAMPIIGGKYCRKIFQKYMKKKGHKAFAYTTSDEGFYGICKYSTSPTAELAEKKALEKCTKSKMNNPYSKKLTPKCEILAINNTLKLSRDDFGLPPFELNLFTAAERMHLDTVKKFVEEGADLEAKNEKKGHTPLILAVRSRRLEVVKYLVEKGADVNAPSKHGRLPLKFAIVAKKNDDVIKYLKSKGAKEKL